MEMAPGYKNIQFQSVNGTPSYWSLSVYISTEMGEQLKRGACPIYREYQVKRYSYSSYDQSFYDELVFDISSKDQPGLLNSRITQSYPSYTNSFIANDLHDMEKIYSSNADGGTVFKKGYTFIGDTIINGKSYNDIFELSIPKGPTAKSGEIKEVYISFGYGLLAFRRTNGLVWFLK